MNTQLQEADSHAQVRSAAQQVEAQIAQSVYISRPDLRVVAAAPFTGQNELFTGTYGIGKTTIAHALANTMGGSFARISGDADKRPSDITGTHIFDREAGHYAMDKGPVFNDVVLVDEIARLPEKTQSSLIEAMAERQVTSRGETHKLPENNIMLATMNRDGDDLREVIADRFGASVDFSAMTSQERKAVRAKKREAHQIEPVVALASGLLVMRKTVMSVLLHEEAEEQLERVIDAVYDDARVNGRASIDPGFRHSENIEKLAKFNAVMEGRHQVEAEDIAFAAGPVLQHRVVASSKAKETSRAIIDDVAASVLELKKA